MLLGVVASAILLLVGGAIGDLRRARPLIVGGLATLVITGTVGLLITEGPVFIAARLIGAAASALTVPAALASVALAYRGVARATALGIAYAIYSGALAVMPILLTFIPGAQWPGFVVAPIAALIALFVVRGRIPDLERPGHLERPYVLGTALWASAVVAISVGVLWLGTGWEHPLRWAIIGFGVALLVAFRTWERRRRDHPPGGPAGRPAARDRRPVRRRRDRTRPVGPDAHPAAILRDRAALRPRLRDAGHRATDRRAGHRGPGCRVPARALPAAGARGGGPGHRRPRQHRGRADRGARDRLRAVHPAAAADRCRVRRRHDRADGDHLRERPARPARDRGGAQRGLAGASAPGSASCW